MLTLHTGLGWDIGVHGDFWWILGCFWFEQIWVPLLSICLWKTKIMTWNFKSPLTFSLNSSVEISSRELKTPELVKTTNCERTSQVEQLVWHQFLSLKELIWSAQQIISPIRNLFSSSSAETAENRWKKLVKKRSQKINIKFPFLSQSKKASICF